MRKRSLAEHRLAARDRAPISRPRLYLVLDRIRSLHNVGSIFRTADGHGVRKIFLGSYTPTPPRPEISKTALGAEETTEWEHHDDLAPVLDRLKEEGVTIAAVEQTTESVPITVPTYSEPIALMLGHEVEGLHRSLLDRADLHVEIPMYGAKHSHNVTVAAGIVLAEVRRQWGENA